MRLPRKSDHRRFCEVDGWTKVEGKKHEQYRKRLDNGDILKTRISRGSSEIEDVGLWKRILREQLQVSEEEFWSAVDNGIPPTRSEPPETDEVDPGIDGWLVQQLKYTVGLREEEIRGMTPEQAQATWLDYRLRPKPANGSGGHR